MTRLILQREEEPESRSRPLLVAALVAALAGGGALAGVWLWRDRVEKARAAEAEQRATEERERARRRAAALVAEGNATLVAAIERGLFPGSEDLAAAEQSFVVARRLDRSRSGADAGRRLVEGARLLLDGRAAEAEPLLREAYVAGDSLLGRYFYGQFLLAAGRAADAWGHFDRVLRSRPGWAPALCGRGLAELQTGEFSKAASALAPVVARYPGRADLAGAYGACLDELGRDAEAADWYRKAIAAGSLDPRVVERFGPLLIDLGRPAEARDVLAGLVSQLPEAAALRVGYARALAAAGEGDPAAREFARALELAPEVPAVHAAYAQFALESHDPESAREHATLARELDGVDPLPPFLLGHANRALADMENAREAFAASCAAGFAVACEEACLAGDPASCALVPAPRREAAMRELRALGRGDGRSRGHPAGAATSVASSRGGGSFPGTSSYSAFDGLADGARSAQSGGRVFVVGWNPAGSASSSERSYNPYASRQSYSSTSGFPGLPGIR